MLDVLLAARDRGLYRAISDCGAGGLSSAVGEMAKDIGAVVWLDRVPLKYTGLSYTEIWISESQERMVLAVPPAKWDELKKLCESEGVEATAHRRIARRRPLAAFLSRSAGGRLADAFFAPRPTFAGARSKLLIPTREAVACCLSRSTTRLQRRAPQNSRLAECLQPRIGDSAIRPRSARHERRSSRWWAATNDGPSDAAVLRPVPNSKRGLVIACGMNPCYADFDTYHMAASAIDEAVRNCVAVGADPQPYRAGRQFLLGRLPAAGSTWVRWCARRRRVTMSRWRWARRLSAAKTV